MITGLKSLHSFCEEWYSEEIPGYEIPQGSLPGPLHHFYTLFGNLLMAESKLGNPRSGQDYHVLPERIAVKNGLIRFAGENQDCWGCYIPEDFDGDAIPVLSDAGALYKDGYGIQPVGSDLTQVLITLTLQEIIMSSDDAERVKDIPTSSTIIWGPARVAFPEDTHSFWISDDRQRLYMSYAGPWSCPKPQ